MILENKTAKIRPVCKHYIPQKFLCMQYIYNNNRDECFSLINYVVVLVRMLQTSKLMYQCFKTVASYQNSRIMLSSSALHYFPGIIPTSLIQQLSHPFAPPNTSF